MISKKILVALVLSVVQSAVYASEYAEGVTAYRSKNYTKAAELFWSSINSGNTSSKAWVYMAHSYLAAGNKAKALDTYKQIAKIFKGTPAEKMALAGIKNIGSVPIASATQSRRNFSTKIQVPKSKSPNDFRSLPLKLRVIKIEPYRKFGHPRVSNQSVQTVSTEIRRLPSRVYKMLEDGGVTVTVAPNIIDKWPDMVKNGSLDSAAESLAKEAGRCYDRDVHVWERKIVPGSTQVGSCASTSQIRNALFHELGHAIDDCSGKYSSDPKFIQSHSQDVKDMPDAVRSKLSYYTSSGQKGCSEACAELVSGFLGANDSDAIQCSNYFRRLKFLVKEKFPQ